MKTHAELSDLLKTTLKLPEGPPRPLALVNLGRELPTTPAASDVISTARRALLDTTPLVEVEGFGSVKTVQGSTGGLPVFFTYVNRAASEPPVRGTLRPSSVTRIKSSAAEAHCWAVAELLDDAKIS